jgi:hypothetical protein
MIRFPIIKSLSLENYELYPKSLTAPFVINFEAGPNAILGVNGSGKTTLITLAFRCITGPYNLPSATSAAELGQVRPRIVSMPRYEQQSFARRVSDGAQRAIATLRLSLGTHEIEITRKLSDLSLVGYSIRGIADEIPPSSAFEPDDEGEDRYHNDIALCMHVASFFDALIVLHFLVFLLEDRRALVWDPTAQRQIFRVLLLPADRATEYALAQQEIVSADSAVRNTSALIYRHRNQIAAAERHARRIVDAEAERRVLVTEQNVLREKVEAVAQTRLESDTERHAARLARLRAAETRENLIRELERLKMEALGRRLGPTHDMLKYILSHLLADGRCLVCGTDPSPVADTIENWISSGACPICGSKQTIADGAVPLAEGDRIRIGRLEEELRFAENQITEADLSIDIASEKFAKADGEYEAIERRRIALDAKLVAVLRRLPPEQAAIGSQESDLDALQRVLRNEQARLERAEARFRSVVVESVQRVEALQETIAGSFSTYLQIFLQEQAELIYQTVKARVGQRGAVFDFPAFHLSMSGGAVAGQTVRDNPAEVSQSQAEFVDLAFRMALMTVAAEGEAATLIVDAPEASLDFLFAERAGQQLANFSRARPANRVIITSYMPSDRLLRSFFGDVRDVDERRRRIVDLLQDSAPNAATRADRPRYAQFVEDIIDVKEAAE